MSDEFDRIKRLPPYVFAEVNRLKAELRSHGKDIIDFGMGNPDMPTPKHIREKLKETVEKPGTGRYSSSKGIPNHREVTDVLLTQAMEQVQANRDYARIRACTCQNTAWLCRLVRWPARRRDEAKHVVSSASLRRNAI